MAVIAIVIGTFAWLLGFVSALRTTLSMASDNHKLIVIQRGALSEFNSAFPPDDFNKLSQLADVQPDPSGQGVLISPEVVLQVSLPRLNDPKKSLANVCVRGVLPEKAAKVHTTVKLIEGRDFSVGAPEVIVGEKAGGQFGGLNIGDSVKLGFAGNRDYAVVGRFSAGGGPMDSEIWGYLPSLQSAYGRTVYSSAAVRLRPEANPEDALAQIRGPAIQLSGQTETEYWQTQAANVRLYQNMCYALVAMMGIAAIFAIANTMFSMVAGRTREIAMLKTIGYGRGSILAGFVIEAVLLSLLGGALGCLGCLAYLRAYGNTKDMFGASTFTSLAFEINLSPMLIAIALIAVALVGAVGALFPAWRAATTHAIGALRQV
jgi:putative ABC transport system permease protein